MSHSIYFCSIEFYIGGGGAEGGRAGRHGGARPNVTVGRDGAGSDGMVGWGRAVRQGGAVQGRMGGGAGGRAARHGGAVQGRIVGGGGFMG